MKDYTQKTGIGPRNFAPTSTMETRPVNSASNASSADSSAASKRDPTTSTLETAASRSVALPVKLQTSDKRSMPQSPIINSPVGKSPESPYSGLRKLPQVTTPIAATPSGSRAGFKFAPPTLIAPTPREISDMAGSGGSPRSGGSPQSLTAPPSAPPPATPTKHLAPPSPTTAKITFPRTDVSITGRMDGITEEHLMEAYLTCYAEDPGVPKEALNAAASEAALRQNDTAHGGDSPSQGSGELGSVGVVNRRAPMNPLKSRRLGKLRQKPGAPRGPKMADPALRRNPIYGKLLMCIMSSAILIFVFFQSLLLNKSRTGDFYAPTSENKMVGPSGLTLLELGALNSNQIRNAGERYRLAWAVVMHSGWIHIALNVLSQIQYLFMFEPDWGFLRCLIIFVVSGLTGNMLSLAMNPCSTTVGSSGALFGLMGAMVTYCIEFWDTIPRPLCMLVFSLLVAIVSLILGFSSGTDNWAHCGGLIAGLLVSLCTMPKLPRRIPKPRKLIPPKKRPVIAPPDIAASPPAARRVSKTGENPVPSNNTAQRRKQSTRASQKRVDNFLAGNSEPRTKVQECCLRWGNACTCFPCFKWKWRPREIVIRVMSLLLLIIFWIVLSNFVFWHPEYQPLGAPTFKKIERCCCCYAPEATGSDVAPWTCYLCDSKDAAGNSFEDFCKSQLGKSKTRNLKAPFQQLSLMEALGFGNMGVDTLITPSAEESLLAPLAAAVPSNFKRQLVKEAVGRSLYKKRNEAPSPSHIGSTTESEESVEDDSASTERNRSGLRKQHKPPLQWSDSVTKMAAFSTNSNKDFNLPDLPFVELVPLFGGQNLSNVIATKDAQREIPEEALRPTGDVDYQYFFEDELSEMDLKWLKSHEKRFLQRRQLLQLLLDALSLTS